MFKRYKITPLNCSKSFQMLCSQRPPQSRNRRLSEGARGLACLRLHYLHTPLALATLGHTCSHAQDLLSLHSSIPSAWNSTLKNAVPFVNCPILFLELRILRITVLILELTVSVSVPYKILYFHCLPRGPSPLESKVWTGQGSQCLGIWKVLNHIGKSILFFRIPQTVVDSR